MDIPVLHPVRIDVSMHPVTQEIRRRSSIFRVPPRKLNERACLCFTQDVKFSNETWVFHSMLSVLRYLVDAFYLSLRWLQARFYAWIVVKYHLYMNWIRVNYVSVSTMYPFHHINKWYKRADLWLLCRSVKHQCKISSFCVASGSSTGFVLWHASA